jgi:hypothetical protein
MKLLLRAYRANKFPFVDGFLAGQINFLFLVKHVAGCNGNTTCMWDDAEIRGKWTQKAAGDVQLASARSRASTRPPASLCDDRSSCHVEFGRN